MDNAKQPTKEQNRSEFPEFYAWVQEMRERFGGELVRVRWPNGKTWEKRR